MTLDLLRHAWRNGYPTCSTQPIVHLATGVPATEEMTKDTLNIEERGVVSRDSFLKLLATDSKDAYYGPIKRQEVKLFNKKDNKKKTSISCDESQSFADVFVLFDEKKLNLTQNNGLACIFETMGYCERGYGEYK